MATLIRILLAAAVLASPPAASERDLDGNNHEPFQPQGKAGVLFFITSDCPISNFYAPEIRQICRSYAGRGVSCALVYEDVDVQPDSLRKHRAEYGYQGIPAVFDSARRISSRAKATVTPQAVIVDGRGVIRYKGRIDNFYAALGTPRRQATVHDVRDALDAVLAGQPVANPETEALGCYIVPADITTK